MFKNDKVFLRIGCVVGALTAVASASTPTFSVEAVAVDSESMPNGPTAIVAAAPGSSLTVDIFVRDWSPTEEKLAAYQVQIEPSGYTSGAVGFIEPIAYASTQESGEENRENFLIDRSRPDFIHAGRDDALVLTDTRSEGYRGASILVSSTGPVSKQDGTKAYLATLKLLVSDNARGTFTIGLINDVESSGMRIASGMAIEPVAYEPLRIVVLPDLAALMAGLNGAESVPEHKVDLDRNGKHNAADVLLAINMANEVL